MYQELFNIYRDKMIVVDGDNPNYEVDKYYYFYSPEGIVGIEKSISLNEYRLIKMSWLEKTFHYDNQKSQKVYEYLFEAKDYPFVARRGRFISYQSNQNEEQINDFLKEYYGQVEIFKYQELHIVFYFNFLEDNLLDITKALEDDLGLSISLHVGFIFDDMTKGIDISDYLLIYRQNKRLKQKNYSTVVDLILEINHDAVTRFFDIVKVNMIDKIWTNHSEIIESFFLNELNVSQTAKALYMHRNSLINRLDIIAKLFGFSIQNFRNACAVLNVINYYKL